MPKVKTKSIVAKRFKITKTGLVKFRIQGGRHIRRRKSQSRKRRQDKPQTMTTTKYVRTIKEFLGRI